MQSFVHYTASEADGHTVLTGTLKFGGNFCFMVIICELHSIINVKGDAVQCSIQRQCVDVQCNDHSRVWHQVYCMIPMEDELTWFYIRQ